MTKQSNDSTDSTKQTHAHKHIHTISKPKSAMKCAVDMLHEVLMISGPVVDCSRWANSPLNRRSDKEQPTSATGETSAVGLVLLQELH